MTEEEEHDPGDLQALLFVGPATAEALSAADYDADDLRKKRVSYRMLVDAGVNPGVAAKLRRRLSLSWSFASGDDLQRRSAQVRGLGRAEAAWVAASSGDWESATARDRSDAGEETDSEAAWVAASRGSAETDGSGDAHEAEAAWRERSKPTPVTALDGVDADDAARLAEGGIISVRSLATADPEHVADVLQLDLETVRTWCEAAREHVD